VFPGVFSLLSIYQKREREFFVELVLSILQCAELHLISNIQEVVNFFTKKVDFFTTKLIRIHRRFPFKL